MQNKSIKILFQNIESFFPKEKQLKLITEYIGENVLDLLFYTPLKTMHHYTCNKWEDLEDQKKVVLEVFIQKHINPYRIRNAPYKIRAIFCQQVLFLVFFSKRTGYLRKIYPEGSKVTVYGKIDMYNKKFQITHPNVLNVRLDIKNQKLLIKSVYRQKKGLKSEYIKNKIDILLEKIPNLVEWNRILLNKFKDVPDWKTALMNIHNPQEDDLLNNNSTSYLRLAYDEILASQISLILVRNSFKKKIGNKYQHLDRNHINKLINILPFTLTSEQNNIVDQVIEDLQKKERMNRLIHGDVGTGKTIIALIAAYYVVSSNYQVAILAPTELLARQHFELASNIFNKLEFTCELLFSSSNNKQDILNSISNGKANIIIGTHSLIQDRVKFDNLSLVVVDEQHRFGVEQRLKMRDKGKNVDMLLLSATPIPRTLLLATLGDINVSKLEKKPINSEIKTIIKSEDNIDEIISFLKSRISSEERIFWVCPMIDLDEEVNKSNVMQRFNILKKVIKEIAVLHGKMNSDEKNSVINDFKKGSVKVLVTTVVIEVGIDIPSANIIIIEEAEKFGLAQIHQLRGRVGRGKKPGTCVLLFRNNLSEIAYKRLSIMKSTNNGFLIAEKDLEMRGGGEILGVKQYGYENFTFFDFSLHLKLIKLANDEANSILKKDPFLISKRGYLLRDLLYIFKKHKVLDLLSAG